MCAPTIGTPPDDRNTRKPMEYIRIVVPVGLVGFTSIRPGEPGPAPQSESVYVTPAVAWLIADDTDPTNVVFAAEMLFWS